MWWINSGERDLSVRTEKQYSIYIFLFQWNTYRYTCLHRRRETEKEWADEEKKTRTSCFDSSVRCGSRGEQTIKVYSNIKHKVSALPFWCDAALSLSVSVSIQWKMVTHFFFSLASDHFFSISSLSPSLSRPPGWWVSLFILLRFFSVGSTSKTKIYL